MITHQPSQPNHPLQNNSWGYQPLHSAAPARSGAYTSTFYSTSAFLSSGTAVTGGVHLGATSQDATPMESSWGNSDGYDDEGNPNGEQIGVIPNPTPIGEPLVMLFFALALLGFRYYRRRNA